VTLARAGSKPCGVRVVFVENDDSFSFNVVDLLPPGVELVRGSAAARAVRGADVVIIGPGPTDPHRAGLVGLVHQVLDAKTPMVGICLGHQALGLACGATVTRSTPAHGKIARMHVEGSRFLPPGQHEVMRYHSLSLSTVKAPLRVTGSLDDGTVMAVEHESLPVLGLQFHPDSYATPGGRGFIDAFFRSLT
jgi:anthranilate synthase/aminodeoxychorismate synthase-like glutamine amidotransferase